MPLPLSQDACMQHPCNDNQMCINKKGTVACIGRHGCAPHHLRTCGKMNHAPALATPTRHTFIITSVDVSTLNCPVVNETETETTPTTDHFDPSSTDICGSDGRTYQSLCHLIQTSNNVRVLYAGPCNTSECQTGQVSMYSLSDYQNLPTPLHNGQPT